MNHVAFLTDPNRMIFVTLRRYLKTDQKALSENKNDFKSAEGSETRFLPPVYHIVTRSWKQNY